MAKSIPTAWTDSDINAGRLTVGEVAVQTDWQNIVEHQNYEWAHLGCRPIGMVFDGAFTTASVSYTQANSTAGGRDLDTWFGLIDPQRPIDTGGLDIMLRTYSQNCRTQMTLYRMDTGASITTANVGNGASAAWGSVTSSLSSTFATIPIGIQIEVLSLSGTANLWQFWVGEAVVTSTAKLPDGS